MVTTVHGVEGLWQHGDSGAVTVGPDAASLATAIAELLADPERCAELGRVGRRSIGAAHAPRPAARARIEAWTRLL